MKNLKSSILYLTVLAMLWAVQTARAEQTNQTVAAAEELLKVMRTEEMMNQVFAKQKEMMKKMIPSMIPKDVPAAEVAEVEKVMPDIMDIVFKKFSYDILKPDLVEVYSSVYTLEEINGLAAFYKTPLGQKLLDKTPEVATKTMQAMQKHLPGIMEEMQGVMKEKMQKIKEQKSKENR